MHADHRVNHRLPPGEFHRAAAALDRGADGDDPADPRVPRPPEHGIEIRREVFVVEVGVGVDQHHENRPEMMLMLRPRMAALKPKAIRPCSSARRRRLRALIVTSETWLVMPMTKEK